MPGPPALAVCSVDRMTDPALGTNWRWGVAYEIEGASVWDTFCA